MAGPRGVYWLRYQNRPMPLTRPQAHSSLAITNTGTTSQALANGTYTITRDSGTGWDAGGRSAILDTYGALVRVGALSGMRAMVGLNSDPATDDHYASIDFGLFLEIDGTVRIIVSGEYAPADPVSTWADGDTFWIQQSSNGAEIGFHKGANLAVAVPIGSAVATPAFLGFDLSLWTGAINVRFGR